MKKAMGWNIKAISLPFGRTRVGNQATFVHFPQRLPARNSIHTTTASHAGRDRVIPARAVIRTPVITQS